MPDYRPGGTTRTPWITLAILVGSTAGGLTAESTACEVHKLETRVLAEKPGRWFGRAVIESLPGGRFALAYREAGRHAGSVSRARTRGLDCQRRPNAPLLLPGEEAA